MDKTQAQALVVRRAEPADAAALTRLREVMLSEMGMPAAGADPSWRDKAEAWFARRLDRKDDFAAFVIDDPDLGVVSCAAGVCDQHAPGPGNPSGVRGHVFNMSTDPHCRRRGYARACLDALLAWFRDETEARVINLNATGDGIALYRSLGFIEPRYPALQLRLVRPGLQTRLRATTSDPGSQNSLRLWVIRPSRRRAERGRLTPAPGPAEWASLRSVIANLVRLRRDGMRPGFVRRAFRREATGSISASAEGDRRRSTLARYRRGWRVVVIGVAVTGALGAGASTALADSPTGSLSGTYNTNLQPGSSLCPAGDVMQGIVRITSAQTYTGGAEAVCVDAQGNVTVGSLIGYPNGPTSVTECPANSLPVGFYGRAGEVVDGFGMQCSAPHGRHTRITDASYVGDSGGGAQGPFDCPAGSELTGLQGMTADPFDSADVYGYLQVISLTGVCSPDLSRA